MAQKRNTTPGAKTRETVLDTAADVASVDGLDGLTIGHLASLTGMSKSGLFAHFGSKQDLQLATIEVARRRYVREVVTPALGSGPGIRRLTALCESFLSYVERGVFPGGCFFAAAMAEFDGKTPGPVRDAVTECQRQWMGTLAQAARDAQQSGELRTDTDPDQLAFELEGTLLAANSYFHLFADTRYLDRARLAVRTRLSSGASTPERTATRA